MYELVSRAMKDLVTTRFDAATWDRIHERARFGSFEQAFAEAPEEAACAIVRATAAELHLPRELVLEILGAHWIEMVTRDEAIPARVETSPFGPSGPLGAIHARLACRTSDDARLDARELDGETRLSVRSRREDWAPVVVGLVKGLARVLNTPVHVRVESRSVDCDEIVVSRLDDMAA